MSSTHHLPTAPHARSQELRKLARFAWAHWPQVVVFLPDRFKIPALTGEVERLARVDPVAVPGCPDALAHFVGESLTADAKAKLRVRRSFRCLCPLTVTVTDAGCHA